MAVQIPRLQRMNQGAPTSVGRIEARTPDIARESARAGQAIGQAITDVDKIVTDVGDAKGNEAARQYEDWANRKLYGDSSTGERGLVHLEGDPTEAYNKFDEEAQAKFEELAGKNNSWVPGVKSRVREKLAAKRQSIQNKRLVAFGSQYDKWDETNTNAIIDSEKRNVTDALSYVDPKNPASLAEYERTIGEIQNTRIERALRVGRASKTAEGIQVDNLTRRQITKDVSEATYNGINNLLAANQLEIAKTVLDKYSDRLDPVHKEKLTEKFEKRRIENNAIAAVAQTEGLPYDQQRAQLNKLEEKVRLEAYKELDALERHKANLKERDTKKVYDNLYIHFQKNLESDGPYTSWTAAMKDPVFRELEDRLGAKQRAALKSMFDRPKTSNPEARRTMLEKLDNREMAQWSPSEFEEYASGLDKSDYSHFRTKYEQLRNPSESQKVSVTNQMARDIRYAIRNSALTKTVAGRVTSGSRQRGLEFEMRLRKEMDQLDVMNMTPGQRSEWIYKRIAEEVKNPSSTKLGDAGLPEKDSVKKQRDDLEKTRAWYTRLNEDQRAQYIVDYVKDNGSEPERMDQLLKWIKENKLDE
jgi:hypothetical protein